MKKVTQHINTDLIAHFQEQDEKVVIDYGSWKYIADASGVHLETYYHDISLDSCIQTIECDLMEELQPDLLKAV